MKNSLKLLDQIIEISRQEDLINKKKNIKGNASKTVGKSWMLHHLEALKELIIFENVNSRNSRPIQKED
ncbi:MAG: hypothetical protein CMI54_05805 [Parcubacteria group bacterium]|nr:hypothetical protein [Parcubacteria group bacterium]|tara:strand:- start:7870 stop:8076 length:207 start_codon:yes stop_codon:yes gene_type:complete